MMTHRYIGTKEVTAWPAEKDGKPGYSVKYADGYTSWSPQAAFEEAYRTSEPGMAQNLTFGDALHYMKLGKRVSRTGWNGKGQWCRYLGIGTDKQFSIHEHAPDPAIGDSGTFMPFFGLKNSSNQFIPWQPSQGDMMAEDWQVL